MWRMPHFLQSERPSHSGLVQSARFFVLAINCHLMFSLQTEMRPLSQLDGILYGFQVYSSTRDNYHRNPFFFNR
jgi:hypothetical protein